MPSTLDTLAGPPRYSTIGAGSATGGTAGLSRRYLTELTNGYNHVPPQAAGSGVSPVFRFTAPSAGMYPGRETYQPPGPLLTLPARPKMTESSPSSHSGAAGALKPLSGSTVPPRVTTAANSAKVGKALQLRTEAAEAKKISGGRVVELLAAALAIFVFLKK